jgi:hypothetical protein
MAHLVRDAGVDDRPGTGRSVLVSCRVHGGGGSNFELIAPDEGDSIYVGFLKEHGEGMHHTCIAYETRDALIAAKTELTRQGRTMVQSADMGELGEFCYFEMPELGSLVELLYLTPLPPPEKTIG